MFKCRPVLATGSVKRRNKWRHTRLTRVIHEANSFRFEDLAAARRSFIHFAPLHISRMFRDAGLGHAVCNSCKRLSRRKFNPVRVNGWTALELLEMRIGTRIAHQRGGAWSRRTSTAKMQQKGEKNVGLDDSVRATRDYRGGARLCGKGPSRIGLGGHHLPHR